MVVRRIHRRARTLALAAAVAGLGAVSAGSASGTAPTPAWQVYPMPAGLVTIGGEPTLGVDPASGDVLMQVWFKTFRLHDLDATGPGSATWTDVSPVLTSHVTADAILKTDPATGRTFVSQLASACSLMAYTDDAGTSWTNVPLGCGAGTVFDHQSVSTGPYVAGGPLATVPHTYPDVVYYCAHDIVSATCAPSVDGGNTFLPAQVVWDNTTCDESGVFGHVKTAPDGTVYVPPMFCKTFDPRTSTTKPKTIALASSDDNGLHWTMHRLSGNVYGDAGHGSLAVATDGTLYLTWGSADNGTGGPVKVAVSHDKGVTWSAPATLGGTFGIVNSRFPIAVAGDPDRAVVAYLGSPTAGDANAVTYNGEWHLYASHTYDGGVTWDTVDLTPSNPIQVGSVCTLGAGCPNKTYRNLLDFNDMVVDAKGRPYIAFTDGCTGATCTRTSPHEQTPAMARLVGGLGVYSAYDGAL
jgi:hypothetical protein